MSKLRSREYRVLVTASCFRFEISPAATCEILNRKQLAETRGWFIENFILLYIAYAGYTLSTILNCKWLYVFAIQYHRSQRVTNTPHTMPEKKSRVCRVRATCVNWSLLHTEKYFRNHIKSNQNQIVFDIFRLIWNQTVVHLLFQVNR